MVDDVETHAPKKRNRVQVALVTVMVLLLVGTQLVSHRPRFLINRPYVVHVADLPAKDAGDVGALVGDQLITIPDDDYMPPFGMKATPDYGAPATPPMLGYSIREVSALGMPFAAYKEQGYVLYVKDAGSFRFAPLGDESLKAIDDMTGRKLTADYNFPWWNYAWSWLLIVLIAAWGWVWWRSAVKQREESGLI